MDIKSVLCRNQELRQQARDLYSGLSRQQEHTRRHLVIARYTCVRSGLVLRREFRAADLMQAVIEDVALPMRLDSRGPFLLA